MSTPEQRAEWRALEQAAPCTKCHNGQTARHLPGMIHYETDSPEEMCPSYHWETVSCDCLIAAARAAVPALLDDVERLLAEKAQLRVTLAHVTQETEINNEKLDGIKREVEAIVGDRDRLEAENAQLRAQSDGRVKMYTWWKPAWFLAVAQARSVSEARQLLLKGELGDSGDGSCPERDRARQLILEETPSMWIGANAEFMLNVNAELREQEDYSEKLFRENAQLRAELREALLEIAGTPPESLWEMEDPRMTYVTIQVDKKDYAAAQERLEELEERA